MTFLAIVERKLPFTTLEGAVKDPNMYFYMEATSVGRSYVEVQNIA